MLKVVETIEGRKRVSMLIRRVVLKTLLRLALVCANKRYNTNRQENKPVLLLALPHTCESSFYALPQEIIVHACL
jgi:hypothetical protein